MLRSIPSRATNLMESIYIMDKNPKAYVHQIGNSDETEAKHVSSLLSRVEQLDDLLSHDAQRILHHLRPKPVAANVYESLEQEATQGQRLADRIAATAGSWRFILMFIAVMSSWIAINGAMQSRAFDPYPFILLNLGLSTLAAIQAPVILMSQNRQADKDRAVANNTYHVNIKSELEIADLHRKIDTIINLLQTQDATIQEMKSQQSNDSD